MTTPSKPSVEIATHFIRLVKSTFELDEKFEPSKERGITTSFDFDVQRSFPTPKTLSVVVTAELNRNAAGAPFVLSVTYEGSFSVADDEAVETLRRFARYNAPGMLLPYVRELISAVTARTNIGTLVLPPLNIQRLVDSLESARDPERTSDSGGRRIPHFG